MPTTVTDTMSQRLAKHVCTLRFGDIPDEVIDHAKHLVIHHLGLALRGRFTEDGRRAVEAARMLSAGGGSSTVIGERFRVNLLDATFANCMLMRANGLDDVLFPVGVHSGLMTIPVALALGEERRSSGRELLTAVVAGYDLIGKLGRPVWAWSSTTPRRPTIAFGPFGAAGVAARLLRLDQEQTANAIGYAAHSAMGLAEGDLVTHYYGLVARNGLMGAILAGSGGAAARTVLDGRFGFFRTFFGEIPPGTDAVLDTLGQTFEITGATTKRYPGTGLNIVPVQLMLDLRRRHGLDPSRVGRVELFLPAERENFAAGHGPAPFTRRTDAASSVLFNLAAVVLDGALDANRFDQFDDPEILDVVNRIELSLVADRPIRYARIVVTTTDGTTFEAEGDNYVFPRSESFSWLTGDDEHWVSGDMARRIIATVDRLDEIEDVTELVGCLRPAAAAPLPALHGTAGQGDPGDRAGRDGA